MIETSQLLETTLWGIPYKDYLISGAIIIATILLKGILTNIIFGALHKITQKTKITWDDGLLDSLKKPTTAFLVLLGTYFALLAFPFPESYSGNINALFRAAATIVIVWGINSLIGLGAKMFQEHGKERGLAIATFVPLFKQMIVVIIWIIGIIMILDSFGFSVASIIAALGIGGAALAFASQDTIANLYGSVAIALDRPFKVGDAVKIGSAEAGVVENIGMRSTQVRTFTKSLISIPNNTVAGEMIDNFTLMTNRRIRTTIGIEYGTPKAKIEQIIQLIKDEMKALGEELLPEPQLVHFNGFGASSLDIEIICYTYCGDILEYFRIREKFFLRIMEIVEGNGAGFAFPTQTLHMFNHGIDQSGAPSEILPPKA